MSRHVWPRDIPAAKRIQNELREKVRIHPLQKSLSSIAGVDAAFDGERVIAVASLFAYPSLIHITDAISSEDIRFPYVPGFLSFREGHAIISAIGKFKHIPDVIIVDGQGIAHPRRLGIASHIGVLLGIPTIGCAKSRLVGEYADPGPEKGQWSPLMYKGEQVGAVLRTRDHVRPVFVSPGHLIDLPSSVAILLQCLTGYRLPEPIRMADHLSKEFAGNRTKG
jgi:deoxyribonuclease V